MTTRSLIRLILIGALLVLLAALVFPRLLIEERRQAPAVTQAYTTPAQLRASLNNGKIVSALRETRIEDGTILSGRLMTERDSGARFELYVMDIRRLADSRRLRSYAKWLRDDPRATSFRGTAGNVAAAVLVPGSDPLTANYPHAQIAAFDRAVLAAFPPRQAAIHPRYQFDD